MSKKLTITVEDEVYHGLHSVVGRRRISRFLNDLARPHVMRSDLTEAYRAMAAKNGSNSKRRTARSNDDKQNSQVYGQPLEAST